MDDDGSGCIDQNEQNYILVTRKAKKHNLQVNFVANIRRIYKSFSGYKPYFQITKTRTVSPGTFHPPTY